MKLVLKTSFERDYARLPHQVKTRAEKQLALLLNDPRHPSLQIKKMEGWNDIWEGRISQGYRFTFTQESDTYYLRRMGKHDILRHP